MSDYEDSDDAYDSDDDWFYMEDVFNEAVSDHRPASHMCASELTETG